MKFQIVLVAIFAFIAVSSKKGFCGGNIPQFQSQAVKLNNCANSNGNALACNSAYCGDANAFTNSGATNFNVVGQSQGGNCY